jgi:type VI protein secretion system component VasA
LSLIKDNIISEIEKQSPESLKMILENEINTWFQKTENSINKDYYDIFIEYIDKAKKFNKDNTHDLSIDISKIEKQLPELLEIILANEINTWFQKTENILNKKHYDVLIGYIDMAKEFNEDNTHDLSIDVSVIEKQLPELLKKVNNNSTTI